MIRIMLMLILGEALAILIEVFKKDWNDYPLATYEKGGRND